MNPNARENPIRMWCDLAPGTGWNVAARGYIQCLKALGYTPQTLRLIPAVGVSGGPGAIAGLELEEGDDLYSYTAGAFQGDEKINLVHLPPPQLGRFWTAGRANIAITTWETDSLPKEAYPDSDGNRLTVVEAMNRYDQVWVPTKFVCQLCIKAGVRLEKLSVVPHVLLDDMQNQRLPPPERPGGAKGGPILFYFVGSWDARKDPSALLRAYLTCGWTSASPVSLLLHCVPPARDELSMMINQTRVRDGIDAIKAGLTEQARMNLPGIRLSTNPRSFGWLRAAQAMHDVFVTASHGEGFCLPALEAAALGQIVIGGAGPVLEELQEVAGKVAVRCLRRREIPITPMPEVTGYELSQLWWHVDPDDLTTAMKQAAVDIADPETRAALAEAAKRVRQFYGTFRLTPLVADLLREAVAALNRP